MVPCTKDIAWACHFSGQLASRTLHAVRLPMHVHALTLYCTDSYHAICSPCWDCPTHPPGKSKSIDMVQDFSLRHWRPILQRGFPCCAASFSRQAESHMTCGRWLRSRRLLLRVESGRLRYLSPWASSRGSRRALRWADGASLYLGLLARSFQTQETSKVFLLPDVS